MSINVRFRKYVDDDLRAWYEALEDKAQATREALEAYRSRGSAAEPMEAMVDRVIRRALADQGVSRQSPRQVGNGAEEQLLDKVRGLGRNIQQAKREPAH